MMMNELPFHQGGQGKAAKDRTFICFVEIVSLFLILLLYHRFPW
jgi:hypothetical protein